MISLLGTERLCCCCWWFPCLCRFTLKRKNCNDGDSEEITVFDYFVKNRAIVLQYSGDLPCINVGKPKRPTYFPVEVTIIWIVALFLCCESLFPANVVKIVSMFTSCAVFCLYKDTLKLWAHYRGRHLLRNLGRNRKKGCLFCLMWVIFLDWTVELSNSFLFVIIYNNNNWA